MFKEDEEGKSSSLDSSDSDSHTSKKSKDNLDKSTNALLDKNKLHKQTTHVSKNQDQINNLDSLLDDVGSYKHLGSLNS